MVGCLARHLTITAAEERGVHLARHLHYDHQQRIDFHGMGERAAVPPVIVTAVTVSAHSASASPQRGGGRVQNAA